MIPRINFSHRYCKFPFGFQESELLDVLPVRLEDLSPEFLRYDTSYLDGGEERQYKLPKTGAYMILLLQASSGAGPMWTTVRSQKGRGGLDKMSYYRSHVGETFECAII